MSKNGKRLVSGVRELILTDGTTLEDLHMVATEVVVTLDKIAARTLRKLKAGQVIRCYVERSNKEYGIRGSDIVCCYRGTYTTKTLGTKLRVYDPDSEKQWGVSVHCLLEVYDKFDPQSSEGRKVAEEKAKTKRKRRKSRTAPDQVDRFSDTANWNAYTEDEYEPEVDGEEYDFSDQEEYENFDD